MIIVSKRLELRLKSTPKKLSAWSYLSELPLNAAKLD